MLKDLFAIGALIFSVALLITAAVSILLRVPYVPTQKKFVEKLLQAAGIKKGQKIYDLGCGDGRILFTAETITGCAGEGYELAPLIYLLAMMKKWFGQKKSQIYLKNFFHANLSDADIIFCYLTPEILEKTAKKLIQECKKGTKIVTHTFTIKGITPKTTIKDEKGLFPTIYIYETPWKTSPSPSNSPSSSSLVIRRSLRS